jgi:hypothetical protein
MRVSKVIFIGKSKKKSGSTRFMLKGLRKRAPRARFLNVPRYRKRYVWSNCKKHIHRRITSYDPDLVLIFSQDIPFEVLEKIKARYLTAIYYHDGYNPPGEKLLRYARQVDYFFLTNKTQIGLFREAGVRNPIFCLEGCDADEHRRVPSWNRKWAAQVAFIGKPGAPHRVELLKCVNRSFELKAWGGDWAGFGFKCPKTSIYPRQFARICNATDIILGCDAHLEMEGCFSNRTWHTLGCGGFLLTNYQPGLEDIFVKGRHLEWYHSPAECLEMIAHFLHHPGERKAIAAAGYEFVHANRTYDIVMDEIISHIETDQNHYSAADERR